MKNTQDHYNCPTELFASLFSCLTGKNKMSVNAGGLSTLTLNTFANTMYYAFHLKIMRLFMN